MNENKNVNRLILGRFISFIGSGIFNICLPLIVLEMTGSISKVGIFFALINIPNILLSPVLGVFIEKCNLKKCIVYCDLLSGALYVILFIAIQADIYNYFVLLFFGILTNLISGMFSISSSSIFIHLVPDQNIEQFNGKKSVFDNLATLIAPTLGTVLLGLFGIKYIIVLNCFSYIVSGLLEMRIEYNYKRNTNSNQSFLLMFKEGANVVYSSKIILTHFILVMVLNFLVSPTEEVFAPGIVINKYAINNTLYGLTSSAVAIGVIGTSVYIGRKRKYSLLAHLKSFFYFQSIIMIIVGFLSVLLFSFDSMIFFAIYMTLCLLSGISSTLVNIPLTSYFQTNIDPKYHARFFSILSFSAQLMIPMGSVFAGFTSSYLGADYAYLLNGIIMLIIVYWIYRNKMRKYNF